MKSVKKLTALALSALALSSTALVGCGKKTPDTEETLEIFVTNAGYGIQWVYEEIKAFKEQQWVKDKYPNLIIPEPGYDSVSIPADKVVAGGKANTADLMISCQPIGTEYNAKLNGEYCFEELWNDVYDQPVPGENIKLKDKLQPSVLKQQKVELIDNSGTGYYAVPWVRGEGMIVYNKTKLEKYMGVGYETPKTTDEWVELSHTLKEKMVAAGTKDRPFAFTASVGYWGTPTTVWWAQYNGKEAYENYWNGVWYNEATAEYEYNVKSLTDQKGRLEALKVLESLISTDNDLNHSACMTDPFMKMQSKFVTGEAGVFFPVGDWLMTEMEGTPSDQDIRRLKYPVVSSIVETLEDSAMTDEQLSTLAGYADEYLPYAAAKTAYETKYSGKTLTEKDYTKIYEARNMLVRMSGHECFVPTYANGKNVAKDFIRFLATDIAIEIFMKTTKGTITPYKYEASEELKAGFYPMQKERYEWIDNAVELASACTYRLNQYGGLKSWQSVARLDTVFAAQSKQDRKSAQEIYDGDVSHWTMSGNANFDLLLSSAGLK